MPFASLLILANGFPLLRWGLGRCEICMHMLAAEQDRIDRLLTLLEIHNAACWPFSPTPSDMHRKNLTAKLKIRKCVFFESTQESTTAGKVVIGHWLAVSSRQKLTFATEIP